MVDQHVEPERAATPDPTILGPAGLPPGSPPANEGRTVAAWTTVAIVAIGAVVAAVGMSIVQPWLAWVGGGVVLGGLVVGGVLRTLGYGQRSSSR